MDSFAIKQLVEQQLKERSINDGKIYILEKNWGYIVQVTFDNNRKYLNELFDKERNIIYSLGSFESNSGEIYRTEVMEMTVQFKKKHILTREFSVRIKELDKNHFIIPRINNEAIGNALFFVDENICVTYKGFIKGKICGNALSENKKLMATKQLLVCEEIDKVRDEYEYFFYSWDKNCRTSDRWSNLYSPSSNNVFYIKDFSQNTMKLPISITNEILRYMEENEAWLAVLKIISKDNKHQRYFISLIGINGLPIIDLTYITPTYEVKTYSLLKEKIGEIDAIKHQLQTHMAKNY